MRSWHAFGTCARASPRMVHMARDLENSILKAHSFETTQANHFQKEDILHYVSRSSTREAIRIQWLSYYISSPF